MKKQKRRNSNSADAERKRQFPWLQWYSLPRWRQLRANILKLRPDCELCGACASHVDHKTPHRGDGRLFWDISNLQVLCHHCHSRKTVRHDRGFGRRPNDQPDDIGACDADGLPVHADHPWSKPK